MEFTIGVRNDMNDYRVFVATDSLEVFIREARRLYEDGGNVIIGKEIFAGDIVIFGQIHNSRMTWAEFTSLANIFN